MIFKVRPDIKKQFDVIHDFGIKNLIVSGCSFTYNNHETSAVTWPYYLKDLGGFDRVLDCSLPGAGNHHIANSLQWAIEVDKPDPDSSLVIVMWSGNDRDDYICPVENSKDYPFTWNYNDNIISGITGGSYVSSGGGNTKEGLLSLAKTKTLESRAIENYLYIINLYNCLQNKGYKFLFLDYIDRSLPSRTADFDIKKHLPSDIGTNLNNLITKVITPHNWAIKHRLLAKDDFHPSPDGHLDWTRKVLLPKLQTIIA
jgi:hypothetical protein